MIERKITKQRCYKIPKEKLDLFLVKLNMEKNYNICFEAEWIFESSDNNYDVVVNTYGSYPFIENEVEQFIKDLK